MKKNYFLLLALFCMVLISSCEQEGINNDPTIGVPAIRQESPGDTIITSKEGYVTDSVMQERVAKNPEFYKFSDSHAELWIEEGSLRASTLRSPTISVTGFDLKVFISSFTTLFPSGYNCDNRIWANQGYITNVYHYKKAVQVPKGYTADTPPENIMSTYTPMGLYPGSNKRVGYSVSELISSDGINDTYYLITEVNEITHDILGRQIASLDNPVYLPCHAQIPSNFIFKYQAILW